MFCGHRLTDAKAILFHQSQFIARFLFCTWWTVQNRNTEEHILKFPYWNIQNKLLIIANSNVLLLLISAATHCKSPWFHLMNTTTDPGLCYWGGISVVHRRFRFLGLKLDTYSIIVLQLFTGLTTRLTFSALGNTTPPLLLWAHTILGVIPLFTSETLKKRLLSFLFAAPMPHKTLLMLFSTQVTPFHHASSTRCNRVLFYPKQGSISHLGHFRGWVLCLPIVVDFLKFVD